MPHRPLDPNIQWRTEILYHTGDAFFQDYFKAIRSAKETIDIETYIYGNDFLGKKLYLELIQAVRRGVQVRLLIDAVGSYELPENYWDDLRRAGVEVRIYHPVVWTLTNINRRNHRKTCVVDGGVAFVGSMNITDHPLEQVHGQKAWRDSGAKLEGASIMELMVAFEWAWTPNRKFVRRLVRGIRNRFGGKNKVSRLVRSNHRGYLRRLYYRDLVWRIENSQERVWLTTPYFVPDPRLLTALKRAAERGIDVRLIMPATPDVDLIWYAGKVYYETMIKSGIRVFEYMPRVLHAKVAIIDSFYIVGSSNLNQRSLLHDLELDVVLTHDKNYSELVYQFRRDLQNSHEISFHECLQRPWWTRWIAQIILLIKYFL